MIRSKVWRELYALFFLDFTKFKNYIKDAIHHPGKLIGLFIQYGLQFVWILPVIFFNSDEPRTVWALGLDVVGAGIMALLMLIFFAGMNKASVKYAPGQYSMADVSFLFPSPISQRTVYAWSMLRQIGSSLYMMLLVIIYLPFISSLIGLHMDASKLVYSSVTIIVISILGSALNFFIYSISHRFGMGKIIKLSIRLITVGLLAYTAWGTFTADNILEGLLTTVNGSVFASIPIIGWAKTLIMAPFIAAVSSPLPLLLGLIAVMVAIVALSIYFAVDYYEEAIGVTEWVKAVSEGNMQAVQAAADDGKTKRKKVRQVDIEWRAKGPWTFVWKQAVANKRASKFIILGWDHVFMLTIGIVLGIVSSGNFDDVAGFAIAYAVMYAMMIGIMPVGLQYELRKQYIYMLPGKPVYKILAVNMLSSIKAVLRSGALILPIWILAKLNINQALSIWLFLISVDIMTLFSAVAVHMILPSYDAKNVLYSYMRMGVQALSMLPAILLAVIIGIAMHSTVAAFYAFAVGALVALILLLYISEKLFARLEMR